jgi:hypothetical protein
MKKRCLMIQMPDHRRFFTPEKNYPQLIEFSKVFGAELSIVRVEPEAVRDIEDVVPLFCDGNSAESVKFELVEIKRPNKRRNDRRSILKLAGQIRRQISSALLAGKCVSLTGLRKKYCKYGLSTSCLCNHVRFVKEALESQGYQVERSQRGCYKLTATR